VIYLYVKTHNKTGLKYLGKTERDDYSDYRGSGTYWKRHVAKHGYDVTTEILLATNNTRELKETGEFFSYLWNIVSDKGWANLMIETGTGGDNSHNIDYTRLVQTKKENGKTWVQTEESNRKRSIAHAGKKKSAESIIKTVESKRRNGTNKPTEETKKKISDSSKGKPKPFSKEHKKSVQNRMKTFNSQQIQCPHCLKEGQYTNMKRWHFDRCKHNTERKTVEGKTVTCTECGYTAIQSPNFYRYHNKNCKCLCP
jgi:hypothetical protein